MSGPCEGQDQTCGKTETKRDRVRRLLIQPMLELGWRKPGGVSAEAHRAMLDRLADDLAYMSDEAFARLREMLRGRGDGKGRDAWPPLARLVAYAEMAQPRPIAELPAMLRWFRSAAGPEAEAAGRLVEEYGYWQRHKHPPVGWAARRLVTEEAERNARRAELVADQLARGVTPAPGEHEWLLWHAARLAEVRRIMDRAGDAA